MIGNEVLLLSVYESYMQPVSVASASSVLNKIGCTHKVLDCFVSPLQEKDVRAAKVILISIPLFDSVDSACTVASHIAKVNKNASIYYFGAYALLNKETLNNAYGGIVIDDMASVLPGILESHDIKCSPVKEHVDVTSVEIFDRSRLKGLKSYSYPGGLLDGKVVGNLETTRGCRFACTHCSVYSLSRGQVDYLDISGVMNDIRVLVDDGATHITFMDPEFMNNDTHGPEVINKMKLEFPELTFDIISRVDRILKYEKDFRYFFDNGCTFVTTALEFPDDRVLKKLRKGYRTKDLTRLAKLVETGGYKINPTLVLFNPWVNVPDIYAAEFYLGDVGFAQIMDPIQFTTRLMITKGSPLLEGDTLKGIEIREREFDYEWKHQDPTVDQLYNQRMMSNDTSSFGRCCVRC